MHWWLLPNILDFLANLAWPAVVLMIFLNLKQPLLNLLKSIKRFKYGEAEVEFDLEKIEIKMNSTISENTLRQSDRHRQGEDNAVDDLIPVDLSEAEDSAQKLMRHWIRFEATVRSFFIKKGYQISAVNAGITPSLNAVTGRNAPFRLLIRELVIREVISPEESEIILSLSKLRNKAVHEGEVSVDSKLLEKYIQLIERVRIFIENKFVGVS